MDIVKQSLVTHNLWEVESHYARRAWVTRHYHFRFLVQRRRTVAQRALALMILILFFVLFLICFSLFLFILFIIYFYFHLCLCPNREPRTSKVLKPLELFKKSHLCKNEFSSSLSTCSFFSFLCFHFSSWFVLKQGTRIF